MRPDRVRERLQTPLNRLTFGQATAKMVDLINLYHSIDYRHGTEEEKSQAKDLIKKEVSKLRSKVGTALAKSCFYYLKDRQAWNSAKEGFIVR